MEQYNLLTGGINTDVSPLKQPENTTRETLNFVLIDNGGEMFSITNEEGTVLFEKVTFPTDFVPMGYTVLDNDIIVVLVDSLGNSQVGYIRQDNSNLDPNYGFYHPSAPYDEIGDSYPLDNKELGFSQEFPVSLEARKLINGHRIVYFTDNNVPFGRIDLDNPPIVGSVADEVKLTFNQSIPDIQVKEIKENVSGSFNPGAYQIITRYVTETGGVTNFGIPSGIIPMVPTNRNESPDSYHGAFNEDGEINKNIVVEFSDLDQQFQELEVVLIYYEGTQSVFKASIIAQIPINSETIEYTITGINYENVIDLTIEELNKVNVSYTRAKCISQKDNVLFLSNLSSDRENSYEEIQLAANKARVSYGINEVQYNGRGESVKSNSLDFELITAFISGVNTLTLDFSDELTSTVEAVGEFTLIKIGNPSIGSVEIVDNTLADGGTITIGVGPSQASVVITLETIDSDTLNKCPIGSTKEETAFNLAETINISTDISEYSAVSDGAIVSLVWGSINASSDGVTITTDQVNITTSNFTGYSNVPYEATPNLVEKQGDLRIELTFSTSVTTSDTIRINNVFSVDGDEYRNGDEGSVSIVAEEPNNGGNNFQLGYTDYINEQFTYSFKTYRRNEVYSFGFSLLYKDGTTSPVFHIPAFNGYFDETDFANGKIEFAPTGADSWSLFNTGETTGKLGTYVSQDTYPNDQFYPGDQNGDDNTTSLTGSYARNIRHHLMPSIENEPHFRKITESNIVVRLINLNFALDLPDSVLKDVQKVMFVRERRSNQTNRSIYAQGLINNHGIMADDYDNDGNVRDDGQNIIGGTDYPSVKDGYFSCEMPFFNNFIGARFRDGLTSLNKIVGSGSANRGCAIPNNFNYGATPFGDYSNGERLMTDFIKDRGSFYSPETVLFSGFRFDTNEVLNASMIPVLELKGDSLFFNERKEWWQSLTNLDYLENYYTADLFLNYNDYIPTIYSPSYNPLIERVRYNDAGKFRLGALDPNEPGLVTSTRWNTSSLEVKLSDTLVSTNGFKTFIDRWARFRNSPSGCIAGCKGSFETGGIVNQDDSNGSRVALYNIKSKNLRQYGQVSIASFIPISLQKPYLDNGSKVLSFNQVYNGDTFITKFSFNNTSLIPYWPYRHDGSPIINRPDKTGSQRTNSYGHVDGIELGGTTSGGPGKAHGQDFRTCNYYFVESNINTYYRHKPKQEEDVTSVDPQNYYPNENNLSLLTENFLGYLDNIRSYNAQYSYENNIKEFFPRGSTQEIINTYENRVIYSETASNDDTLDSYRSFLQSNYYDLPSNTGPIWNSFVFNNELFLHTTKSLWRTFAEVSATLSGGNIDDVVLGTGRLFARPSSQVTTMMGGYGGTISQYAGCSTRIGYIFPDVLQEKVFALMFGEKGGMYLKELSEDGLQTFFKDNLSKDIIKFNEEIDEGLLLNYNLIDNPYTPTNPIGLISCYDQNLKRFILTKKGVSGFTKSFSALNQKWFSHSYSANMMIAYNNQLFFIKEGVTWEMNKGERCNFFDQVYDCVLEVSCNFQMAKKTFKAIVVDSESSENSLKIRDNSFTTLQVYNDRQNSFELTLKQGNTFNPTELPGELLIKFRNDEYRISVPRDSVIDNNQDIFDDNNKDFTKLFREKIKGDFALFKFTYNNDNKYKFTVHSLKINFNKNER
jgi:hypothetical protein